MKIKIVKRIDQNLVEFNSHVGNGIALLTTTDFDLERLYDVEFNIDEGLSADHNTRIVENVSRGIEAGENSTRIYATVENIDEDNEASVRVADDFILMSEILDDRIKVEDHVVITIEYHKLRMSIVGW